MLLNELIKKNENGDVYVSSLELHKYLEIKTRHNDWIRRQIKNYGFVNEVDFTITQKRVVVNNGGYKIHDKYNLKLNTAKELAMVERTEIGRKTRQYFIQCEQELINMKVTNLKLGSMLLTHREKLQLTKEVFYPILDQLGVLQVKKNTVHQLILKNIFGKYENINKLTKITDEDIENYKRLAINMQSDTMYFEDKNQITVWDIIKEL